MQKNMDRKFGTAITPAAALAFSLGTSIGWGSLVVTANTYLSQSGPMGSVIGLIIGALIMLVISRNYHYMINCFPDAGGSYAFARDAFGFDYGFLTAWFLMLTYLAMLWANATAIPLFARNFFGEIFHFGYMYTVFGYDVYAGEVLLTLCSLGIAVFALSQFYHGPVRLMVVLAAIFTIGITVCFAGSVPRMDRSYMPYFIPAKNNLSQIIKIAVISPWAFIGFENISHFSEEYTFERKKIFRVLTAAVITATILYIFVTVLSVTAYPPQYSSWLDYYPEPRQSFRAGCFSRLLRSTALSGQLWRLDACTDTGSIDHLQPDRQHHGFESIVLRDGEGWDFPVLHSRFE